MLEWKMWSGNERQMMNDGEFGFLFALTLGGSRWIGLCVCYNFVDCWSVYLVKGFVSSSWTSSLDECRLADRHLDREDDYEAAATTVRQTRCEMCKGVERLIPASLWWVLRNKFVKNLFYVIDFPMNIRNDCWNEILKEKGIEKSARVQSRDGWARR